MSEIVLDNFATIRAIRGLPDDLLKKLIAEAAEDNHYVHSATHVMFKNREIAGYLSVAAIPTIMGWFSTKKLKARDSLNIMTAVENQLIVGGATSVMTPMPKTSPFHPHMEALGFEKYYNGDVFIKDFYGRT